MRRESLRRHGVLEKVEGTGGLQLFREARGESKKEKEMMGDKQAKALGLEGEKGGVGVSSGMLGAGARTDVEGRLEGYKGRGKAVEKFKETKPLLEERE